MLTISNMTETDIPFAKSLTDVEGWGYRDSDFRRLIALGPDRCFVAWRGRKPVGTVSTTRHEDYTFIGTLIVKEEERGNGIGRALMERTLDCLWELGVKTIELDAVISVVPMYRKLGFKDKYLSLRLRRVDKRAVRKRTTDVELPDARRVIDFDREMTGLGRSKLLNRYLVDFRGSFFASMNRGGRAYAVVKRRANGALAIGPFIAEGQAAGKGLLKQLIGHYPGRVLTIGTPAVNVTANSMFIEAGFVNSEPSLRMYLGKKRSYEKHTYGIASPEKG